MDTLDCTRFHTITCTSNYKRALLTYYKKVIFFYVTGAVAWITITADHKLEQIEISRGAQLVIAGSAKTLTVDSITDDNTGHLYLLSPVQLQVNSLLSPCAQIFHGAELVLSDIKPNVSLERSVDIYGTLTINGDPSVYMGKEQGVVTMHPGSSPNALKFGELIIESMGHLQLLNYDRHSPESCRWSVTTSRSRFILSDSSKMDVKCPCNLTGDQMTMGLNSALKIKGNSSVSYVSMNDVRISGTFDPGVLSLLEGWKTLRIERYGDFSFFPLGDVRLDTFYSNGNFHVEGALFLRGRDPAVTRTIEVDQYGSVQFDLPLTSNSLAFVQNNSQEFGSHGRHSLNGTSLVHADIVVVDGTWLPKKLKIEPGWKGLTVEQGGLFHFDPVGDFHLNRFHLNGDVKSLNAVKMAGLSQERILHCEVGFYGVVLIESVDLTTIPCHEVFLSGTLRVGNLSIGSLWDDLTVYGANGRFYFETIEALNINRTNVSGLMATGSALGPSALFTGDSFIVEQNGEVSIHYQAQPSTVVDGTINSTFHVTTVRVDGLFKLGSLYLVTDNLSVGSSGRISVDGGGALGGMGPGAGAQKDSGGAGASHGGRGGRGTQTLAQPLIYGDIFTPGGWGSGGGNGSGNTGGGRGGGKIFLQISNSFNVNGLIQMNGLSGQVVSIPSCFVCLLITLICNKAYQFKDLNQIQFH